MIEQLCAELAEVVRDRDHAANQLSDLTEELSAAQDEVTHRDTRLLEVWELTSTGTAGCATRSLVDQVIADVNAIVAAAGADSEDWTSLTDVRDHVTAAVEILPNAQTALRNYLVSRGLPSDPLALDDPDLWALCEALL